MAPPCAVIGLGFGYTVVQHSAGAGAGQGLRIPETHYVLVLDMNSHLVGEVWCMALVLVLVLVLGAGWLFGWGACLGCLGW